MMAATLDQLGLALALVPEPGPHEGRGLDCGETTAADGYPLGWCIAVHTIPALRRQEGPVAKIKTIALAHARCLHCGWLGEGFLTAADARDDAENWHPERCPGPAQANAHEYLSTHDSETGSS